MSKVKTKPKKADKVPQKSTTPPKPTNDLIWGFNTVASETELSRNVEWTTMCGRYKVCRTVSKYGQPTPMFAAVRLIRLKGIERPQQYLLETERQEDGKGRGHYAKYYHNLDGALQSVEQYHISKYGTVTSTNRPELVCHADKQQLAGETKQVKAKTESQKPPKEGTPRKTGNTNGSRGVGIVHTIVKCLKSASAKKPISKGTILKELTDKFPDRPESGMRRTVDIQISTRLRKDKGLDVQGNNDKGFWIPQ